MAGTNKISYFGYEIERRFTRIVVKEFPATAYSTFEQAKKAVDNYIKAIQPAYDYHISKMIDDDTPEDFTDWYKRMIKLKGKENDYS